ncbi:MAG: KpsF/GutQ family sugar-phosphate isomerase [Planctomycetota bacterium]
MSTTDAEAVDTGGGLDVLGLGRTILAEESEAVARVVLDEAFVGAVGCLAELTGETGASAVVIGLGKSGLIGQKIAATLASTGTPAHFVHPVEAMHGDLGRIRRGDVAIALSYSGTTDEVLSLCDLLKRDGVTVITITGPAGNPLARVADYPLHIGDVPEACPLNLAPSASTTAMLALGDALALAVSSKREFTAADFQRFHPGGGLGRQLMGVTEAMRFKAGENLTLIERGTAVSAAYQAAETGAAGSGLRRPGALLVVEPDGTLAGIVTDGDLRSALIKHGPGVWDGVIESIMTSEPTTLGVEARVRDAVHLVRTRRFDEIPVVDETGRPKGLIDVQDLAALKVIER